MRKSVAILGIRGVPAAHGGFETFAEYLALYLAENGWEVTVYCQEDGGGNDVHDDVWRGVRRVFIPTHRSGAVGTVEFDWKSIRHAAGMRHPLVLTLGYNTASFCLRYKLRGVKNVINMDGIEWMRDKWKPHERAWLWLNERIGCLIGDHLVADHPQIKEHLETRVSSQKITMIPYGARPVLSADAACLSQYGVESQRFFCVIARPEPENSVLEVVQAFSRQRRGMKLLMLGKYDAAANDFHAQVISAASDEVIFPGAVYDKEIVDAIRFHSLAYIHGHRVGGTNPSLVEALGAKSAVVAHNNRFNRWVAGDGAVYFDSVDSCEELLQSIIDDSNLVARLKEESWNRFNSEFTWDHVLKQYEELLMKFST
jgi:glycosyltransferase involved in cell wall biosynthesis